MRENVLIIFLMIPAVLKAQNHQVKDTTIPQSALNRIINNTFSKLVTSNPSPGEVASYVALDPINANFTAKAAIPLRRSLEKRARQLNPDEQIRLDPGRFAYLSLSASGSLTDKKYGVLFSEAALNTGVSLSAQWNFMLWKPTIVYYLDSWQTVNISRELLIQNYRSNYRQLELSMNEGDLEQKKFATDLQLQSARRKWQAKLNQLALHKKSIDSLGTIVDTPALGDSYRSVLKEVSELNLEIRNAKAAYDSLNILSGNDIAGQKTAQQDKLGRVLLAEYDSTLAKMEFQKLSIGWFTVIGGYNRTSVNTFNAALPFDSQLDKDTLPDAAEFGFAWNHLHRNYEYGRTRFFNISLSHSRKTNLDQLSTVSVDQARRIVNATGDTIRTISSKTSVYTDPIVLSSTWTLASHFYYAFGKTPQGIHIFPSVDFRKGNHRIASATLGYLISFKAAEKDRSVVNSELYFRFKDIFDDAKADVSLFKRSEIGLSFSIPFNVF